MEGLNSFLTLYSKEYGILADCLVDRSQKDEYGMFTVRDVSERLRRIDNYLQIHQGISRKSSRILRLMARNLLPFGDAEKHFQTCVHGAAFTLVIYQNDKGETLFTLQARVFSRGNALTSLAVVKDGTIKPDDIQRNLINDSHSQMFDKMFSNSDWSINVMKGKILE